MKNTAASGSATPLAAELCYDKKDPYAVAACFRTGVTEVRWVFARDLLAAGLYERDKLFPDLDYRDWAAAE